MHDDAEVTALGARFDADEERLRGVALRLLGTGAEREAEAEAVLGRVRADLGEDAPTVLRLCLTALVARACLDAGGHAHGHARVAPEPDGEGAEGGLEGPEGLDETVLMGFLAVLDRLGARHRLAYLLHDVFGLPPGEAARVMGGTATEAARRARRARDRLRGGGGGTALDGGDSRRQRALVDAFLSAARARDAVALTALLDPEAIAYTERGPVHGAAAVALAAAAALSARPGDVLRPALVEGTVGVVAFAAGSPVAAVAFGFRRDRIVSLDITTAAEHLSALDLAFPDT
ncbi:sigma factor-like helix-turn-helix DNA-binding protein [Streptomyces sp. NPDC058486]|uniref:sigma factor-like helix-turn-helix DNA-binding protein n=1 Tax=unclassified Streptomyces TaxID=2593676 RepID=UPI00365FBE85